MILPFIVSPPVSFSVSVSIACGVPQRKHRLSVSAPLRVVCIFSSAVAAAAAPLTGLSQQRLLMLLMLPLPVGLSLLLGKGPLVMGAGRRERDTRPAVVSVSCWGRPVAQRHSVVVTVAAAAAGLCRCYHRGGTRAAGRVPGVAAAAVMGAVLSASAGAVGCLSIFAWQLLLLMLSVETLTPGCLTAAARTRETDVSKAV